MEQNVFKIKTARGTSFHIGEVYDSAQSSPTVESIEKVGNIENTPFYVFEVKFTNGKKVQVCDVVEVWREEIPSAPVT